MKHPFHGATLYFSTKHEKEKLLAPLLNEVGISCVLVLTETDAFGTFSGEVERIGSVRETLRKKIKAAEGLYLEGKYFLASEGSFGPHPHMPFIKTNVESLLFWDKDQNLEIYADYLSMEPVHDELTFGSSESVSQFLSMIQFPTHGVIVHPENSFEPIFKGIHDDTSVAQAILSSFAVSKTGRVTIKTDLRALHNPTRQSTITKAGVALIEKLKSLCPTCQYPGFGIEKGIPGLSCAACGMSSPITKDVVLKCVKCAHEEIKPRPDGKTSIDPSECEFCNP